MKHPLALATASHPFRAALAGALHAACLCVAVHAASPTQPSSQTAMRWRDASMEEYRRHLTALAPLVQACAKARNLASCDPALIGPDDRVPLSSAPSAERRMIRYGWLRVLFSRAEDTDQPVEKSPDAKRSVPNRDSAFPPPPTTSQLLEDAEKRLADDLAQANNPFATPLTHVNETSVMKQVLAGAEFRNLNQETVRDSILEKIESWLNRLFANASRLKAGSPWVGVAVVSLFVIAVCTSLIWVLWRLERRWRVRLIPEAGQLAGGTASTRDWQLLLEDARSAASRGQWREAIHLVYWASISRLESRRLWPADLARTPREYLALLPHGDPRKGELAQLTASFERTWYGSRPAGQGDYGRAEGAAESLMAASNPAASPGASAHEGGMR